LARHKEPLSGGLVTIRDPALLEEGQLSYMQNLIYFPDDPALHRSAGRTVFGTVSATAVDVNGLRDMKFDNGDHYLVAQASGKYRYAPVGVTGTFSDLATLNTGTQLEAVQYRNRYFFFNGVTIPVASAGVASANSNTVAYLSATSVGVTPSTRVHGLLPVNAAPATSTAASNFSQSVTGYYEYWTTEVAKITQDGAEQVLESTFEAQTGPATYFAASTAAIAPVINLPTLRNPLTTHWRVYRSPKKEAQTDKKFPVGFLISSDISTATAGFTDSYNTASASSIPASANAAGAFSFGTSATSMFADDGVYGTLVNPFATTFPIAEGLYAFNFGGFSGTVAGIVVELQAFISNGSAPAPITVTLGANRQSDGSFGNLFSGQHLGLFGGLGHTVAKSGLITATSAPGTTLTLGSATDRWFGGDAVGLSDTHFGPNFMVVITNSKPLTTLSVDYVKVTVYYGGSTTGVVPFPTVVYTFGDISAQVGKNGPPPSASTGDMFEGCLVTNDTSDPGVVRYSYPDAPEYFPSTYYIPFETRDNDAVQCIKVVNQKCVVGLNSSLWRINYLPSERDASFDRGKAVEAISNSFGIVNPMCACVYSPGGGQQFLAFVSNKGIHATDGHSFKTLTDDIEWRNHISLTSTSTPIALVNDPENYVLRFYYRNDGNVNANETYLELHVHYDGRISGPTHMRNFDSGSGLYADLKSAWSVPRSTGDTSLYFGYGSATAAGAGKVYIENGTAIPSNDTTTKYTTRRMYLAGEGSEWELQELYGYCGNYSGAPALIYTVQNTKTDDGTGEVTKGSKSRTLGGEKLHKVQFREMLEGARITMQATASGFQQEYLLLDGTNFGLEDSGKG
jgi:hypothetical protein